MQELLIVIADFFLPEAGSSAFATDDSTLNGLASAARFGATLDAREGWRAFLARWLGRADIASAAPASVASAAVSNVADAASVFIAQPVHLITGLRSVHLDHAGLLRLDASTQAQLIAAFQKDFADTSVHLHALAAGSLLLASRAPLTLHATDPARYLGATIEGAFAAQKLGAEMEMWLHEHPINVSRARVRQRSISTLWLWGGGEPLANAAKQSGEVKQVLFGADAYLDGLVALGAARRESSAAENFPSVVNAPAERAAIVLEAFHLPENSSISTPLQAVEALDRQWIAPAVEATMRGRLQRLQIVANDRRITLGAKDRFKFWRRPRRPLTALQ